MRGGPGLLVAALAIGGCTAAGNPLPPPGRPPPPVKVAEPPVRGEVEAAPRLPPPEHAPLADPIVASDAAGIEELEERVAYWTIRWLVRSEEELAWFRRRMVRYVDRVDSVLIARRLPRVLRYLPLVESGYDPRATSPAGAAGLWQLMAGTARVQGLRVTSILDERRDPLRSTDAALDYLETLRDRYRGSWFLALAAYNAGPGRLDGILRRHAPTEAYADRLYVELEEHVPAETRDFVPKLLAVRRVAEELRLLVPEGGSGGGVAGGVQVVVPDATSLDVVARAAGAPLPVVEELNPHILRGYTPPGSRTGVWVPEGTAAGFGERYARVPPEKRVSFVEHRIRKGETLTRVASLYDVSLAEVQDANPGLDPRRLQIGSWVVVPRSPASRGEGAGGAGRVAGSSGAAGGLVLGAGGAGAGSLRRHRVRPGESLWEIARSYGIPLERLREMNDLTEGSVLYPGDELRLPEPG